MGSWWATIGDWEISCEDVRAGGGGAVARVALLRGGEAAGFVLAAVPGCAELACEGLSRESAREALGLLARNEEALLDDLGAGGGASDPRRPVDLDPGDPRVATPEDVGGWMLWDDEDFDPDEEWGRPRPAATP